MLADLRSVGFAHYNVARLNTPMVYFLFFCLIGHENANLTGSFMVRLSSTLLTMNGVKTNKQTKNCHTRAFNDRADSWRVQSPPGVKRTGYYGAWLTPRRRPESWTHAVKCCLAVNDKCMVIPGTCWLLLLPLLLASDCCWKFSRAAVFLTRVVLSFFFSFFLKVFRRLLKISKKRWPSRALSELTPTGQTAGKKSASGVQRASKFETTFAEATMAVTFSGCEIQHQPWPRPLSLMGPVIEKVDVLFLSRCAPRAAATKRGNKKEHSLCFGCIFNAFLAARLCSIKINKNTVFYHSLYLNNETKHTVQTWIFIIYIFYLLFFFDKTAST